MGRPLPTRAEMAIEARSTRKNKTGRTKQHFWHESCNGTQFMSHMRTTYTDLNIYLNITLYVILNFS